MKRKKIESVEYVLEEQDIQTIKECLNYCYHRLTKHKCGAPIHLEEVQRLRKEFGISVRTCPPHFESASIWDDMSIEWDDPSIEVR